MNQHTPLSLLYSIYCRAIKSSALLNEFILHEFSGGILAKRVDTSMYFADFSLLRARTQCHAICDEFHFHICSYFFPASRTERSLAREKNTLTAIDFPFTRKSECEPCAIDTFASIRMYVTYQLSVNHTGKNASVTSFISM